jgi:hypothetical protein
MLEFGDLPYLRAKLDDLLNDRLSEVEELSFIEPDLEINLCPKYDLRTAKDVIYVREGSEIQDIYMELIIHLSDSTFGYNGQSYTIPFNRNEIKALKEYLDSRIPILEEQWRKQEHSEMEEQ